MLLAPPPAPAPAPPSSLTANEPSGDHGYGDDDDDDELLRMKLATSATGCNWLLVRAAVENRGSCNWTKVLLPITLGREPHVHVVPL